MTHELPGILDETVELLRKAGLYVEKFDNEKYGGGRHIVLRGGSHTEGDEIKVIRNAFYIEVADDRSGYLVVTPGPGQLTTEVSFGGFLDTIEYVLKNWKART